MSASGSVAHSVAYVQPSRVIGIPEGYAMSLATSGGVAEKLPESVHPYFFHGALVAPLTTARCLTTLAKVVAARYVPTHQERSAMRDPVVTSGGGYLRFEGFSSCGGVYGRLDLMPPAYDGVVADQGTTNVDFNAPMRQALARIRDKDRVDFSVGDEEFVVSKGECDVVEQKVKLPKRWIKGFTEVQAYLARMEIRHELKRIPATQFLRALPRNIPSGTVLYVIASGRGLRFTPSKSAASVRVCGVERLHLLSDLVPYVQGLRIYGEPDGETSTWELDFGGQCFSLTLSPENTRGFSGEGQVLNDVALGVDSAILAQTEQALHWQAALRPGLFAGEWDVAPEQLRAALSALGSRGLVGYDCQASAYFHRVLPFDLTSVDKMHPRLIDARKVVATGGVTLLSGMDDPYLVAEVLGTGVTHRVQEHAEGHRCTCQWFTKYAGRRGVCKHILAAQIAARRFTDV